MGIDDIVEQIKEDGDDVWYDSETGGTVINGTDLDSRTVMREFTRQHPEMAALQNWGTSLNGSPRARAGGLIDRDRYVTPIKMFDKFRVAKDASTADDVVSGVLESTEALAFNKLSFECDDEDQQDIWNQILKDIELDVRIREMWRELFTVSQVYVGVLWHRKTYKVTGKKKKFLNLNVPKAITILDPLKVVPVGNFLFGQERLAYVADKDEVTDIDEVLAGVNTADLIVKSLFERKYEPSEGEKKTLQAACDVNVDHLYLLKQGAVFRHTVTRPAYERFADCRMTSVFELLDMKHQLRQMDRAYLIGGTNFIVLVKKGSEQQGATQREVNDTATQIRMAARVPIIVSDHRLEIEIITPKLDMTLKPERYNTLDARITARLYQMFMTGNYAAGASGDDSIKLARVVARGMESRRLMLSMSLTKNLWDLVMEKNKNLDEKPDLTFHPRRIALDFDPNYATYIMDLRDRGDLSRDFVLTEIDVDQDNEFKKRKREKKEFDTTFEPTNVPFSGTGAPAGAKPGAGNTKGAGRTGGGKTGGGGMNRTSQKSQPGRGPSKAIMEEMADAFDQQYFDVDMNEWVYVDEDSISE